MKIALFVSGLFPDAETIEDAIGKLDNHDHTISRIDASHLPPDDTAAWDMAVREIMMADNIITI